MSQALERPSTSKQVTAEFWRGTYHYPEQKPGSESTNFHWILESDGLALTGNGIDLRGLTECTLNGQSRDNCISLVKQYAGDRSAGPQVVYTGQMDPSRTTMSGTWTVGKMQGSWSATKAGSLQEHTRLTGLADQLLRQLCNLSLTYCHYTIGIAELWAGLVSMTEFPISVDRTRIESAIFTTDYYVYCNRVSFDNDLKGALHVALERAVLSGEPLGLEDILIAANEVAPEKTRLALSKLGLEHDQLITAVEQMADISLQFPSVLTYHLLSNAARPESSEALPSDGDALVFLKSDKNRLTVSGPIEQQVLESLSKQVAGLLTICATEAKTKGRNYITPVDLLLLLPKTNVEAAMVFSLLVHKRNGGMHPMKTLASMPLPPKLPHNQDAVAMSKSLVSVLRHAYAYMQEDRVDAIYSKQLLKAMATFSEPQLNAAFSIVHLDRDLILSKLYACRDKDYPAGIDVLLTLVQIGCTLIGLPNRSDEFDDIEKVDLDKEQKRRQSQEQDKPEASAEPHAEHSGLAGSKKKATRAALIAGVLALKWKAALALTLKALSVFKAGWMLTGVVTVVLSLCGYALLFGWPFAVGLVGLLFAHEMGHYIYLKHMNLEPKAPVFIPFVGAFVAMKNLPKERIVSAWSAFWGPCLGGIIAGMLLPIGLATHSQLLIVLSVYGVGLNLLQLTPSRPLDGGFIAETIWKWLTIPGALMLLAASFMLHSGFLGLLALVGFVRGIRVVMGREKNKMTEATVPERLKLGAATVALSGCLIGTMVVGIANVHVKPKSVTLPGSHASASEKTGLDQSDPEHAQLQQLVGVE